MDLSKVDLHLIGSLSSYEDSIQRAKALIDLAESNAENAKTLAGSAIILLAIALEQGVKTILSNAAEMISMETGMRSSDTSPGRYLEINVSSRLRVRSLPRVLTDGQFQLDPNHVITKSLEELIDTRNKLTHVNEPAIHLVGPSHVKVEEGFIRAIVEVPLNPWSTVTTEKAKSFEQAVDVYSAEVLFPDSGKIAEGTIVISAI